ncbi:hypothetical protein V6N13_087077 [Hibiscus sabdariffa]|uniref:Uncharacterized protein n=1 Tax=Hibiscus sabdariffa TaxID=183260 RepID=A0ABR2FV49_9ROSI
MVYACDSGSYMQSLFVCKSSEGVRVSPSITDAAVARLAQGTKLLAEGGHDRLVPTDVSDLAWEKALTFNLVHHICMSTFKNLAHVICN